MDYMAKAALKQQAKSMTKGVLGDDDSSSKQAKGARAKALREEKEAQKKAAAKRAETQAARRAVRENERDRIRDKYNLGSKSGRRSSDPGTTPTELADSTDGEGKNANGCAVC